MYTLACHQAWPESMFSNVGWGHRGRLLYYYVSITWICEQADGGPSLYIDSEATTEISRRRPERNSTGSNTADIEAECLLSPLSTVDHDLVRCWSINAKSSSVQIPSPGRLSIIIHNLARPKSKRLLLQ